MDVLWLITVAAWPVLLLTLDMVIRVLAVIYIPRNRRPQTALAWLVLIFVVPVPGILLFFLFGSRRLPASRRRKQREINSYILETTDGIEQVKRDHPWPPWLEPIVELNRKLGAMPLVGGNTAAMHTDYEESIAAMTAAVESAKKYVHVEFYILSFDKSTARFFDAMKAAVDRGVVVRVLLDHVAGLRTTGFVRTLRALKRIGAQAHVMLPVQPFKGKDDLEVALQFVNFREVDFAWLASLAPLPILVVGLEMGIRVLAVI